MAKRSVQLFVSYAHRDMALARRLLESLEVHLQVSKTFDWHWWREEQQILVGEDWHQQIQRALADCDCGLLLVSPALLASRYVIADELARLIEAGKPILPVGLGMLDLDGYDMQGLDKLQIFQLPLGPDGRKRAYAELTDRRRREQFAFELFRAMERRMGR